MKRKIGTAVRFPRNFEPVPGAPSYELRGVIEHRGSGANSGHYVAYVRHHDHVWSFCDDGQVPVPRSFETVLGAQAYVLVYETVGARGTANAVCQTAAASAKQVPPGVASGSHCRDAQGHASAVSPHGSAVAFATLEPVSSAVQLYSGKGSAGDAEARSVRMRRGVVSGFGSERTDDALGDAARRDDEACARQRERRNEGVRGRARDWNDEDLDRSFDGPRSFGRR